MACTFVVLQLIIFLQFCEIQGNIAERAWFWDPRYGIVRTTTAPIDGNTTTSLHIRWNNPRLYINFKEGLWRIKGFQVTLDIWSGDSFRFSIQRGDGTYITCYEESVVFGRSKYTWNITCVTELQGKSLVIANTYGYAELRVYEVIVNSCSSGTYGNDCEHGCPMKCQSDCYLESGQCRTCAVGKYGDNCDRNCSIGCYQNICRKDNGQCTNGCKKGYNGIHCSPCRDGTYGHNCRGQCPEKCRVSSCDNVDGTCSSCLDGYAGHNCLKCRPGRFGLSCHDECDYCLNSDCDNFGQCNRCIARQYGSICDKSCSLNCGGDGSCSIANGVCSYGCNRGYNGSQCSQCPSGTYGDGCRSTCSVGCIGLQCDHITGNCSSCLNGYSGNMCSPCPKGRFGVDCNNVCNYCLNSNCDHYGSCHDCNAKWYGQYCNKTCPTNCGNNGACIQASGECLNCKEGFYGQDCSNSCNVNCSPPKTCSRTGVCTKGCVNGWVGDKCDQQCAFDNCVECNVNSNGRASCSKCRDGWFLSGSTCLICPINCTLCESSSRCSKCVIGKTGRTCSKECNNNCINRTCNIDGKCDSGCLPGHYDTTCDKRCSDKCLGGYEECGTNGYCLRGCTNRTHGKDCNMPCPQRCLSCYDYNNCSKCEDGYYGSYCGNRCPINCLSCKNKTFCSKCLDGYHGTSCQDKCPSNCASCLNETFCLLCETGWSGSICQCNVNCSDSCGENGQCKNGCKDGLYGIRCERLCPDQDCVTCNQTSGNCSICISGKYGQHCDKTCSKNCLEINCAISGECLQGCADGFTGDTCALQKMEAGSFPLLPVVLGVLAVIIVLIILAVILMSRRKSKAKNTRKESRAPEVVMSALGPESRMVYENMDISVSDNTQGGAIKQNKEEKSIYASRGSYALLIELDPESTDIQENEGTDDVVKQTEYYNVQVNKIAVSALSDVIQKKKDNDEFQTEFESLPQGLTETYTKALEKKNKKRNRYKKIYPYDFNRVKLIGDNTNGGDYINASYVHGFSKENAFIAAQGPFTDDTLVDFWRMIWQKKVTKIVMLTNLVEGQVTKCWKYWPDDKERYGLCDVSLTKTTTYANCAVRTLNVKRKSESKQMQVNHFHFTAWPDKDVPKSASTILDFRNKVVRNESSKDGPTLVHCSAGIGRTGTYIALDYLVREGEQEGSVDILNCLTTLRRQRTQFVQTVEQYEFLHEALLEGLTMKDSSVDTKDFPAMYDKIKRKNPKTGKTFLREQFDDINTMIPNEKEGNFATAKLPQNRTKNRYSNILAADNCRYFVTSSNGSDYINAIAIQSHNKTAAFALTQMPLPDTIEDFWNLVLSQSMTTIVMMNVVKKEKDPDIYWPLSGLSTFGKIKVQQLEEDVTNEAYRILKLSVTRVRSNECLVVKQFQCLFWPDEDGVPRGTRQMLQLMEDVDSWQRSNDNPTIVVHCLDGARKSGLFCAVSAILERVRAEQTVNVVRTISQMRSKRQQIVSSQEQLEYCYDVVNEYLEMSNTYTNV